MGVLSGVVRLPFIREKNIFTPPPTETVEFEIKNSRKITEEAKAEHFILSLIVTFVLFRCK